MQVSIKRIKKGGISLGEKAISNKQNDRIIRIVIFTHQHQRFQCAQYHHPTTIQIEQNVQLAAIRNTKLNTINTCDARELC
jgi:hypothetical protein